MPREHFTAFARQLRTDTLRSADRTFIELTGSQREASLLTLWQQAGRSVGESLPHVAVADGRLARLDVIGASKSGGQEVLLLSLPPAVQPGEAAFIALARRAGSVRVLLLERCAGADGEVHPSDALLVELRGEAERVEHGRAPGLDLEAFKRRLGALLGVSLAGIERSLPEVGAAEFVAAGRARAGAHASGVAPLLVKLLAIRACAPLVLWLVPLPLSLHAVTTIAFSLLSLAIAALLIVWLYRVHELRRGHAMFSPGWAVGGWFIPGPNLVLAPLSVASAWKATVGPGGAPLVFAWWLCSLVEAARTLVSGTGTLFTVEDGRVTAFFAHGASISLSPALGELVVATLKFGGLFAAAAYGLLWYIVRRISERL